jgi:hypothetical protein
MNDELKSMWKDAVVTYLKELSQEVTIRAKTSVILLVLLPRTEPGTYRNNVITSQSTVVY